MMKKLAFICAFLAALTCISCNTGSEDGLAKPTIDIFAEAVQAPAEGTVYVRNFTAESNVSAASSQSWCRCTVIHNIKVSSEGSLKITIGENDSPDSRTARVTLSADGCEDVVIEVHQAGQDFGSLCEMSGLALKKSDNPGLKEDISFIYDPQTGIFKAKYLKWIDGDSPEMLKPSFKIKGAGAFVRDEKITSGMTAISFAEDFIITVKATDGSSRDYKVVFNCPQINTELAVLHMKPDRLINSKDSYVDTYIELYDKSKGSTGEGWWDSAEKGKIEMRGRGNSTWGLPKKPFRMKFTEKFSPIGLNHAKEKSWVLLAQDMDKSLIRTHIAWEYSRILFNPDENYHHEKCLNFTPCSKYVNVYLTGKYYYSDSGQTKTLDGEYIGVYQMSDQMERASGRIAVEKLEEADGNDPEKITGGYILETDIHEGNHYTAQKRVKLTYKYPKDDDYAPAQYTYITDYINEAERVLYSSSYTDPQNGWRKYFDEKSLADFIIIKELVGDMDGYTSTYMYKRRDYDKIFFGPIWDCDKGWDNEVRTPHGNPLTQLMIHAGFWMPGVSNNDWFHRLWSDEELRKYVGRRWAEKKGELKAITEKVLSEVPASMSKALDANFTVWPFYYQHSSEAKMPAQTYEAEIERIRTLTSDREALLDRLFQ